MGFSNNADENYTKDMKKSRFMGVDTQCKSNWHKIIAWEMKKLRLLGMAIFPWDKKWRSTRLIVITALFLCVAGCAMGLLKILPPAATAALKQGSGGLRLMLGEGKNIRKEEQYYISTEIENPLEETRRSHTESTLFCDRSSYRTDVCFLKGELRTQASSSSTIFLVSNSPQQQDQQTIKPYTRKWDNLTMSAVTELSLKTTGPSAAPRCHVTHRAPALVFSTGGFTGNLFHDFTDVIIPLFITTRHFNSDPVFLVLDHKPWWNEKFQDIINQLTPYPILDIQNDTRVHCFTEAIVGLRFHGDLMIDPAISPYQVTITDFQNMLKDAYGFAKRTKFIFSRPKFVLIARKGSRVFLNQRKIVNLAEKLGFRVMVLTPDRDTNLPGMEGFKRMVVRIAYTPDKHITTTLSPIQRCLCHFLAAASHLYTFALKVRKKLYEWGIFKPTRLAVPVISVGNLTWGGNGKTPMTEFLALLFAEAGISPLILTRGYAGGDETRMLQRHLIDTSIKIGSGPNRANIAASFLQRYGVMKCHRKSDTTENVFPFKESETFANKLGDGIGVVILDDGMQHWSLSRDLEIVMLNCISLWGNGRMIPRGPLRESLKELRRADLIVLHHADLISNEKHQHIKAVLEGVIKQNIPIFFSKMVPCYFFRMQCQHSEVPLNTVHNMVVLCVSGIGCPESLSLAMQKLGAGHVDRVDFSDHHNFQDKDLKIVQKKLQSLEDEFGNKAIVIFTEKDYERSRTFFSKVEAADILVLHSTLAILCCSENSEASLKTVLLNKVIEHW